MAFAEDYYEGYRVKFVDVRVNPPGGRRKSAKAAAARQCEHKGCDAVGECKAPKPGAAFLRESAVPGRRGPIEEHYWFCQRHAAEYNRTYDFFDGMTESEILAFHSAAAHGLKRTWRFGTGLGGVKSQTYNPKKWGGRHWVDPSAEAEPRHAAPRERTRLQTRALDEMDLPHDANPARVRERYAELVKRFHPDSNGGDRSMEHRLNVVIRAFKALKSAGLA